MAVGDAHVFPGFLTPVLTQLFFPKPPITFLTCFCRGERRKYAGKTVRLNRGLNSQPPGHESDTLITKPPERLTILKNILCLVFQYFVNWKKNMTSDWPNRVGLANQKFCYFPKPLTLSQTTDFGLFQIQSVCRQQFQILRKSQKFLQTGRKHCEKRRNCNFSFFHSVFKRLVHTRKKPCLFRKELITEKYQENKVQNILRNDSSPRFCKYWKVTSFLI